MRILSVDIGSVSLKYVVARKKGTVEKTGIYPYSGDIDDLSPILAEIRENEGKNFETRILITTTEILKRTFTIPTLPKGEMEEAIKWSLSKVLGESPDTYVFKYGHLGPLEEKGIRREEMYFVGAKREFIEHLSQIFENEGFKNISLITDASSAYAQIVSRIFFQKGSFAILDIGGRLTGLYIFKKGRLSFIREILTAGESFTDALISGLGLTFEEAEKEKIEKGFTPETELYLNPPFERLAGEIERTINVYNQRYPDEPCTHLYFTGRGSRIKGLKERLKEVLPLITEPLLLDIPVEEEFLPAYVISLSGRTINLLPAEKIEWKKEVRLRRIGIAISAITLFILFFLSFDLLGKLKILELEIRTENKMIAEKRDFLSKNISITPEKLKEIESALSEAKKRDKTFVFLLKSLSALTPENVYFKELGFEKDKDRYLVELKGISYGDGPTIEEPLLRLVMVLEKYGVMREVNIREKNLKETGGKKFLEFVITGFMGARIDT